jgi:hypothetical protein
MGKRSGVPDHDDDLDKLTLDELNAEIARCKSRLDHAPTTYLRKAFFKQLTWLERYRESAHGIPAPKRTMRARSN